MTVRFRHLRLRATTGTGPFGADVGFEPGLNVLWAPNTAGKSTCLQAILYALGLERMLSPRRDIPLTYVMTSHLEDPQTGMRQSILESSVLVEMENGSGEVVTVRRGVVGSSNSKLVSVFDGPLLTQPADRYRQRDYFVRDPGAAQREAGFHHFLAEFFGWSLPTVRRFDGSEVPLYLETIFPLLYVEQKAGWASVPAAFPTYFQIRDVGQRAVEFLMALETHDLELRRQQLDIDLAASKSAWTTKRDELVAIAGLVNAQVKGVPLAPTTSTVDLERSHLLVPGATGWIPLDDVASQLRLRLAELSETPIPQVESVAPEAAAELERLTVHVAELNERRSALFRARQAETAQRAAVARRLAALEEDLQKNLDAQKLRNLGSAIAETFAADHCPTCAQPIADTLLAQRAGAEVMPVEDNIEYIRSQRAIFQRLRDQSESVLVDVERQLATATVEVNDMSTHLRALKADLIAPSHAPSVAALEDRIRTEARFHALEQAQERFALKRSELLAAAEDYAALLAARSQLPAARLSATDKTKIERLGALIRDQAASYGFSTFPPSELEVSEDNYRPQKEGFEIGFELSASDAIRLKWAYQLALLELGRESSTNHPGFVIFDEPRQQETAKISFRRLLERASVAQRAAQQVIFATSEDRDQLEAFLSGVPCRFLAFDGPIVRRL